MIIPLGHASLHGSSDLPASLTRRASAFGIAASSRLFGLAPCGVYLAACITACAVRSYRTFSPLPLLPGAVSSLWHLPSAGLETSIPGVTRHTALRSSDFPPPLFLRTLAAIIRSVCSGSSIRGTGYFAVIYRRHHSEFWLNPVTSVGTPGTGMKSGLFLASASCVICSAG